MLVLLMGMQPLLDVLLIKRFFYHADLKPGSESAGVYPVSLRQHRILQEGFVVHVVYQPLSRMYRNGSLRLPCLAHYLVGVFTELHGKMFYAPKIILLRGYPRHNVALFGPYEFRHVYNAGSHVSAVFGRELTKLVFQGDSYLVGYQPGWITV